MFLHRHPRTLLTSEQLSAFVGYDIKEIATSLEAFMEVGLLERTQNPKHAARMYALELDDPQHSGVPELLKLASTRNGRHRIRQALSSANSRPDKKSPQAERRFLRIA